MDGEDLFGVSHGCAVREEEWEAVFGYMDERRREWRKMMKERRVFICHLCRLYRSHKRAVVAI